MLFVLFSSLVLVTMVFSFLPLLIFFFFLSLQCGCQKIWYHWANSVLLVNLITDLFMYNWLSQTIKQLLLRCDLGYPKFRIHESSPMCNPSTCTLFMQIVFLFTLNCKKFSVLGKQIVIYAMGGELVVFTNCLSDVLWSLYLNTI